MNRRTAYRPFWGRTNRGWARGVRNIVSKAQIIAILGVSLGVLASGQPAHSDSNIHDACKMMQERSGWFQSVKAVSQKRQVPIPSMLAVIHQESRFNGTANARDSSAYGFAQALDGTWDSYRRATKSSDADRSNFADSVDFIGWYMTETRRRAGVADGDTASHYLAYHEGIAGFRSTRWTKKPRLIKIAKKVARTARTYEQQLEDCALAEWGVSAPTVSILPRRKPFALSDVAPTLPRRKPIDRQLATVKPRFIDGRGMRRLY